MMTNKEKAREIAGGLYPPISGYEAGEYDGALEMAKWKDKQCPTKDVIRKVLDIVYDHQYVDRDGMHNLKFEAEEVIEHWND